MDRVELFSKIEGKTISITANGFSNVIAPQIRISLDAEIQWHNSSWLPNWDAIEEINEIEPGVFSFYDTGRETLISLLD